MFKETEAWSPDQELQFLEELADGETEAFDMETVLAVRVRTTEPERPWVAYWQLPPDGVRPRSRACSRLTRGR
jgi:hypothetical protein